MDTTPALWLASLAVLVLAAVVANASSDERAKNSAYWAAGIAVVALSVLTLAGLWQAWSPWELTRR